MSDITAILEGLRDGTVSTDDAAAQFAGRQWPVRLAHEPAAYPGDVTADGSFGEVNAAYAAGWIDDQQYAQLARAAGAAIGGDNDDDQLWYRDPDGDNDPDGDDWETAPNDPTAGDQEDLFDGEAKALPQLTPGSYVKTPDGGRGRITAVNAGSATVSVWENSGRGWADTGRKITQPVGKLTRVPPPMPRASSASPDDGDGDGDAEQKVYQRGVQAYPGETKTALSPHDWATARVEAFRSKQAGIDVPGYTRDDDLLSPGW